MPNHITTVCTVTGSEGDVAAFALAHVKTETKNGESREWFDFGTIIPKPECVDASESSNTAEAGFFALTGFVKGTFSWSLRSPMGAYANRGFQVTPVTSHDDFAEWLAKHEPEVLEKGRAMLACLRATGYPTWYEWSIANWGTKWGAYSYKQRESKPGKFTFEFQTAWSVPEPIFEALADRYPELAFDLVSIDEGGPQYEGAFHGPERLLQTVPDSADRYRLVYGREPYSDEDDEDEEEAPEQQVTT